MINVRRSSERGQADHGWLKSAHSFSFADYYDPEFMGFRTLRVINEDHIAPGGGFPTHAHRDMEIVTFVIEGLLRHTDTLGNSEVIRPGEIQRMSAGSGIRHSEFNDSKTKSVHLLQIWFLTEKNGIAPSYEQKSYLPSLKSDALTLIGSHDGRDGSVTIHQDVSLYYAKFAAGGKGEFTLRPGRHAWIQMMKGSVSVTAPDLAPAILQPGDAIAVSDEKVLAFETAKGAEFLFFDLN